jgi:thiamine transport system permease protein
MAQRAVSISLRLTSGAAALLVVVLTLGTLATVGWRAVPRGGLSAADLSAIRFTVWQAVLSAVFSIALAIPTARALARRKFPGRGVLVTLLGAPFLLPVIVAVLGLLAVFGRGGILNTALGQFGIDPVSIYGLWGVVLAHVFFNLPLATRLILQGWVEIPSERFRLAATLNARSIFIRGVCPSAAPTTPDEHGQRRCPVHMLLQETTPCCSKGLKCCYILCRVVYLSKLLSLCMY